MRKHGKLFNLTNKVLGLNNMTKFNFKIILNFISYKTNASLKDRENYKTIIARIFTL